LTPPKKKTIKRPGVSVVGDLGRVSAWVRGGGEVGGGKRGGMGGVWWVGWGRRKGGVEREGGVGSRGGREGEEGRGVGGE